MSGRKNCGARKNFTRVRPTIMNPEKNYVWRVVEARRQFRPSEMLTALNLSLMVALLGFPLAASAETAAFPQPEPAFTVNVPIGCKVEFKEDEMWIRANAADEIAYFRFRKLPQEEVYDRGSALKFLESYGWAQIRSMGIADGRFRMFGNTSLSESINGFHFLLQGTWDAAPGGSTKVGYHATAFSADATQYFLLVSLGRWTSTVDKDREDELEKSLQAVQRADRTIGFPKDDPVFTVRLSEHWQANTRKDAMELSSAKGDDIASLWQKATPRAGITLEADADREAFTVRCAEGIAKQLEMADPKCTKPVSATTVAGHKASTTTYEGQRDGQPSTLDVMTFTPNGRSYFLCYGVAAQSTGKTALEHQGELVASVKAVGKQP